MQSSLAARYASPPAHSGLATPQKKNTRLPGPSRGPAAGSVAPRSPASSNLNRRSQSFNSIDKSKPLQYASGNDRDSVRAAPASGPLLGGAGVLPSSPGGPAPAGSAIPSLSAAVGGGKSWRSKSMNLKHSATSSLLGGPSPGPPHQAKPGSGTPGSGVAPGSQGRSMLEKFRLIHPRVTGARATPNMADMPLTEEDDGAEGGDDPPAASAKPPSVGKTPAAGRTPAASSSSSSSSPSSSSSCSSKGSASSGKAPPPSSSSSSPSTTCASTREREEARRPGRTGSRPAGPPEADPASKKTSRIASLIPKGGSKPGAGKKEGGATTSSIPKSGLKAPSSKPQCQSPVPSQTQTPTQTPQPPTQTPQTPQTQTPTSLNSSGNLRGGGVDGDKAKPTKGGGGLYTQRSLGAPAPPGARRTSMTSSTSTSALSGTGGGGGGGVGVVQLPQQQQHHPNTATVAPFMYRTFSENDCSMVVPVDTGLSPTKGELVYSRGGYSKTAKQCLQEISGEDPEARRMRTVKNIADLRQNLEETMSSLRGTQVTHSTMETTFDTTVTTEVNGRGGAARPSPMAWRLGQSQTPRLQAGDVPSPPGGFTAPRATAPAGRYSGQTDAPRYMSDGGLPLYGRGAGRGADPPSSREVSSRTTKDLQTDLDSWDDSSSVSSGLSDTLENISTDDLNAAYSSSACSSSSRKNKAAQAHRGRSSRHAGSEQEVNSSWAGAEDLKKVDEEEQDLAMDPSGTSSRWKSTSTSTSTSSTTSQQQPPQYEEAVQKSGGAGGSQGTQTGSLRRGMGAQVGISPPRTKTSSSSSSSATLKSPGKTDDVKASEKVKTPSKTPAALQRSPSDAGKGSGDEGKKPPTGTTRTPPAPAPTPTPTPTPTASFGYKKHPLITSGSATLGKMPRSAAGQTDPSSSGGGRKTSLDGSGEPQDEGLLLGCSAARMPLQYRSLPRPAKSSSGGGGGGRGVAMETGAKTTTSSSSSSSGGQSKRRDAGGKGGATLNQTDKEKVAGGADPPTDPGAPRSSPTAGSAGGQTGLRQPGSKYPDIASPTFRRLFGAKAGSKASTPGSPGTPDSSKSPSLLGGPHAPTARQPSLDSPDGPADSPASSPASGLSLASGARPWPGGGSSTSKDTLSCHSMSSLHTTSSDSMDLTPPPGAKVGRASSVKSTLSEGMPLDRNTLPKKGLRYPPSSRQPSHEEGTEWLRSHSTGGLQDSGSQSPLSPPGAAAGKYHYSNLLSPTSNTQYSGLPAGGSLEQYRDGPLGGSSTSLEERPRAISRSGSFRDSTDEVHGSSLSLVSSTSSLYSAVLFYLEKTEEKAHSEGQTGQNSTQIRKLRRELDASQEKVATLTSQLSANAHLVAAFEMSLGNMTCRLQSLTMTAEQKESELAELRETIEMLKTQNTDAQTAIQVALNGPDHLNKDLRIRRQHSSESMSSITSGASHASLGSLGRDPDEKKRKKKSWLRSSFKQAFSKKKSRSSSSHEESEEMSDSLPSSPKLPQRNHGDQADQGNHGNRLVSPAAAAGLRCSPSGTEGRGFSEFTPPLWIAKKSQTGQVVYKHGSRLYECSEAETQVILQLKNELREKELKLTDIRLEALSSAHHLDQIREAMNRMQNEIETLKAENDRLKSSGNATPTATPLKTARPPSETSSTSSSSSRQSLGLSLNNLNITDTIMSDILLDDGYEGNVRKEGRSVRIVVSVNSHGHNTKGLKTQDYLIGSIGVSGKTKWDVLDGVIRRLFKEYVFRVDPLTSLGLGSDSILSYRMGEVVRGPSSQLPELLPCAYLVGHNNLIQVQLKGVKENSIDSLVFDTLVPKAIIQRYLNLLSEHRRIILSGPSGTGKSFLAAKLAAYIVAQTGSEVTEHTVASFNVDQKCSKVRKPDLRQYLSTLAERCASEQTDSDLPTVVVLDNLHHIGSLSDIFNGFLNCKYHKCPYVIGTMNQGMSCSPNLGLHHNFRWVLCANHTEPVKGFLGRFLRRKLIETEISRNTRSTELIKVVDWLPRVWQHLNGFLEAHSSSDITIGPRLLLSCPMDVAGSRLWFTDLWNYSLVPYLLEAVREGLQLYGKRAAWEDPSKWANETYPWSPAPQPHDSQSLLLQLRPEDVGYDGFGGSKDGSSPSSSSKPVSQSDTEGDPLMSMLLRLQEAANYSTQSCDSDSASHHDDQLDSSLESAL
ncbi:neuron navigator 3 isoform X4 [Gadus morhua]|uniref:neuron navigator 3 isoform X4 n=1 Tax=Gadus morhua TaxID=8049 RepID=UPI0011B4C435|nr:neuron navigator 3 isoform X4 [Gadus morhua]